LGYLGVLHRLVEAALTASSRRPLRARCRVPLASGSAAGGSGGGAVMLGAEQGNPRREEEGRPVLVRRGRVCAALAARRPDGVREKEQATSSMCLR
jgi:hypothetical protein